MRRYASDEPLQVRICTHQQYTQPRIDFVSWVLGHIPWRGDERVLDIGCGAGTYITPTCARLTAGGQMIGADLSPGMLRAVVVKSLPENVSLLRADATSLPLPDACCQVVLANHMLFKVPSIQRTLAEIRRVLQPGGYLVATTNALDSMQTFTDEMVAASRALGHVFDIPPSPVRRFALENGAALIAPFIPAVQRYTVESALVFCEATPAVDYVNSLRHTYAPRLPSGLTWPALMDQVARQIEAQVADRGEYRVPKNTGVFVASKTETDAG